MENKTNNPVAVEERLWISIENPPKKNGFYIVNRKHDDEDEQVLMEAWQDDHFEMWVDRPDNRVTHWQPMPKPFSEIPIKEHLPQPHVKELQEVMDLDQVINTYVHGAGTNRPFYQSLSHIQEKFWVAIDAIQTNFARQEHLPVVEDGKYTEDEFLEKMVEELPEYGIDTSMWEYTYGENCYSAMEFISRILKSEPLEEQPLKEDEQELWKQMFFYWQGEYYLNPHNDMKDVIAELMKIYSIKKL